MIALDTNVLVRFIVEDDSKQTERAKRLIRKQVEGDTPCFVSDVVLCELVWVLQSSYKVRRPQTAQVLESLLRARHLVFESTDRISRAIKSYRVGKGDFADYVIREQSMDAGAEAVATFDEDLLRDAGFMDVR